MSGHVYLTRHLGEIEVARNDEHGMYHRAYGVYRRRPMNPGEKPILIYPGLPMYEEVIFLRARNSHEFSGFLVVEHGQARLMGAPVEWTRDEYERVRDQMHEMGRAERQRLDSRLSESEAP